MASIAPVDDTSETRLMVSAQRVRTVNGWSENETALPRTSSGSVPYPKKSLLRPPKTVLEKILCYCLCFLFIVMMVFLSALCIISERWKATLSKLSNNYANEDVVCQTDACQETAQKMISNIDSSADPCEDFYQYACGGWMENNAIPNGKEKFMSFDIRSREVSEIVVGILNGIKPNVSKPKATASLRKLFRGCIDTEKRNSLGVEPVTKLLKDMGGWPMVEGEQWDGKDFSWYKQAANVNRKLLMDVFIEISLLTNIEENDNFMLYISRGDLMFTEYYATMNISDSNKTKSLFESIAKVARLLGSEMEEEKLQEEAKELVLFEYGLNQVGKGEDEDDLYEIKISELEENVTYIIGRDTRFTYKELLNLHLQSDVLANDETLIYVLNPNHFVDLPGYMDSVEPRVVANYISYWIVTTFASYTVEELWTLTLSKTNWTSQRACASITKTFMSYVLERLYIDKYFPSLTRYHVKKMIEMIRLAYSSTLDQNNWMDKDTLLYSLVKLQSIDSMVGYPEWILDDKLLDKYYEKVLDIEENDYFGAILKLCILSSDVKYRFWNETAKRNDTIDTSSVTVNAFYVPRANYMVLPAGILGYPFYKYNRIDSINYGGIGTIIGHEISHAFDDHGRKYDHLGNYRNWWTKETRNKFNKKSDCFVEQYDNFVEDDDPMKVDGKLTLSENIADNGAIRNAFKAFRLHLALSDEDMTHRKTLPGLPATPEQLFFLGYASIWCANMTDEYAKGFRERDEHSTNKLRVNIPLANFREFARAFQCNPGTPMNPKNKCVLW